MSQVWTDVDNDRTGMIPFVFDDSFGFEQYVDYALDVPMWFVYRKKKYIDCSGLSFRDFMAGKLAPIPGELPTLNDWENHLTTIQPEWVEAIPLKNATGPAVANFIKENIICRFGVPNTILSDNGTPFINKYVKSLLETYQVKHHKSTPYYPKGNGQAEATNKTLIRILSKMMDEFGGTWSEQLIVALWAYRTSKRKPTQATPYSLVYGSEAVLPIELETPSARMALASGMVLEPRTTRLEALEEKHDRAAKVMERYHESIARAYNQTVRLKKYLEMRGADVGPRWSLSALPAFWVGLLYDDISLQNVLDLIADWTAEERQMLRNKVPKSGLKTPFRDGLLKHVAEDVVRFAKDGLERRGFKETGFLNEVAEVVRTGVTPAGNLLESYHGKWGGSVDLVFEELQY
ncbi:unnamed protein product [Camellia sinensis]